jgi:hypothetical protein
MSVAPIIFSGSNPDSKGFCFFSVLLLVSLVDSSFFFGFGVSSSFLFLGASTFFALLVVDSSAELLLIRRFFGFDFFYNN